MRFHSLLVAALALGCPLLDRAEAFTNGTMLPSYLCGPAQAQANGAITGLDGYPKALGGVLAQMIELTPLHPGDNGYIPAVDPRLWVAVMHSANTQGNLPQFTQTPANANNTFAEAALGTNAAMNKGGIITAAQTNVLHVGKAVVPAVAADQTAQAAVLGADCAIALENVVPAATTTTITPNQLVTLTLQAQNNVLGVAAGSKPLNITAFANAGTMPVLDGAIVYAQTANNARVGFFTTGGPNMAVWNACGTDRKGIVQTALLSPCTNSYTGPQFFLPFDWFWKVTPNANGAPKVQFNNAAPTTITFMGAAVSDNGFGYHQTPWTVTPPPTLNANLAAINIADMNACEQLQQLHPQCLASCLDCAMQAGSTTKVSAQSLGAKLWCTAVAGTGNGIQNAPQNTQSWTATCTLNNKVLPVVPPGSLVQQLKAKDATGADMSYPRDTQLIADAIDQNFVNYMNATDGTTTQASCTSTTSQVGTATNNQHTTWITTLAVAVGAWFTARQ